LKGVAFCGRINRKTDPLNGGRVPSKCVVKP
jgi:hypothetical protein